MSTSTSRSRISDYQFPDVFLPQMDRIHRSTSNAGRFAVLSASLMACAIGWAALAPYDQTIAANGTIDADLRSMKDNDLPDFVSTLIPAEVQRVCVKEGDRFNQGQTLLQLDVTELKIEFERVDVEIERLNQTLSDLSNLQTATDRFYDRKLSRMDGRENELKEEIRRKERIRTCKLQAAEARSLLAESKLKRMRRLQDANANSESELEIAKAEHAEAQAWVIELSVETGEEQLITHREHRREIQAEYELELEKISQKKNTAQSELENSKLKRQRLAEQLLKDQVVAPYDGVVTELEVAKGQWLDRGRIGIEIAPHRALVFTARVDSRHLRKIETGQEALIYPNTFDALKDDPIVGVVARIDETAMQTTSDNGNCCLYPVEIKFPDDELDLALRKQLIRLGMEGTCRIKTGQSRSMIAWLLSNNFKQFNQP